MKVIGVACGGYTSEREISLKSGNLVFNLIKDSKFECYKIDVNKKKYIVIDKFENNFLLNKKNFQLKIKNYMAQLSLQKFLNLLKNKKNLI